MKYVKCKNCGKLIPFGSEVTIWKGYVGVFCTDECAYNYYASDFIREARLNDKLADDQSVKVEDDL